MLNTGIELSRDVAPVPRRDSLWAINRRKSVAKRALALRIAGLQVAFVRRVNDIHIFLQKVVPLIVREQEKLASSEYEKDRDYAVPKARKRGVARRTDDEVAAILDRFTSNELYQTFVGTLVAHFEPFLGQVLREVLAEYPRKLTANFPGIQVQKDVPVGVVLDTDSTNAREELIEWVIDKAVGSIFYAAPKFYLEYLTKVGGIVSDDPAFDDYLEIKATRDLIVHNSGVINDVYLSKAGEKARGEAGQMAMIDREYFNHAMSNLKRLSGIIKRNAERNYPVKKKSKGKT
jgi:hypothetical protein